MLCAVIAIAITLFINWREVLRLYADEQRRNKALWEESHERSREIGEIRAKLDSAVQDRENLAHSFPFSGAVYIPITDQYLCCYKALEELVRLKTLKDSFGQTPEYLENKEKAWSEARAALAAANFQGKC